MKILDCALNGPRNISEFTYGGEHRAPLDTDAASDRDWAEHVFFPHNRNGVVLEWWCHTASAYWFLVERDTRSDEVRGVFRAEDIGAVRDAGPVGDNRTVDDTPSIGDDGEAREPAP